MILVDDADGQISRFRRGAGRDRIDRNAEGIGDQNQHHRVGADASQLLDDQTKDVLNVRSQIQCLPLRWCCLRAGDAADMSSLLLAQNELRGDEIERRKIPRAPVRWAKARSKPSALVKAPTLIGWYQAGGKAQAQQPSATGQATKPAPIVRRNSPPE